MILLSSADFLFILKLLFQKIISGTLSEYQMVWIQIRNEASKEIVKPYDSLHMKYYFSNIFGDVIESSIFFIYFICSDNQNF